MVGNAVMAYSTPVCTLNLRQSSSLSHPEPDELQKLWVFATGVSDTQFAAAALLSGSRASGLEHNTLAEGIDQLISAEVGKTSALPA